jgi:hypothetical protein
VTSPSPTALNSEIVGHYADRAAFEAGVAMLIAAGFDKTDLSVLASHDSLEVAGGIAGYDFDPATETAGAVETQVSWLGPLVIADMLLATAGPVGIAVAALATAAAGAVALRPVLSELTETLHAESFALAVAAGNILVWVRADDAARRDLAERILAETGARGITAATRRAQA